MEAAKPSCRLIPAFDETRPNAHWTACLVEGEFAVRNFDPKTNCVVGTDGKAIDGNNDQVLVFRGLDAAGRHCASAIADRPATGCLIYNASGVLVRTHVNPQRAAELAQPPSRRSQFVKGLLLLLAGTALVWWDWSRRWTIMIGVLLGIRLLLSAFVFLWRAIRGTGRSGS